ncbi:proteasome assembly chaperone 1-like [Myxocyprinus asiaticus]|uniref:proteasome assembly chaperone 1-like n=1 Tax=Myxocyprinus asiaticus TaxID=70543 RepID=UPI002221AA90|nr:proteasome assembly chaperone 1-like [Myxocyprinus asiaticus]
MATFFGEVLSVYSRAVEEDEYDDMTKENEEDEEIRRQIDEKRSVHVQWINSQSHSECLQCSDLIISVGPNACGFISAYVLSSGGWSAIGWISLWNERSHGSSRPHTPPVSGEPACVLYQQNQNPSVVICQCTCYIAEDQLFQWTEKVLGCVQKRDLHVSVLSDCAVTEYKTLDYLSGSSTPFLRALKTGTHTGRVACPLLEQPNIITGLPAAVLSHCQVHRIPAVLYQCYSDVTHPDSVTMETYKPALACLSAAVKCDECPSAEILQKFTRVSEVQSNLYT